mgnify:FL=1
MNVIKQEIPKRWLAMKSCFKIMYNQILQVNELVKSGFFMFLKQTTKEKMVHVNNGLDKTMENKGTLCCKFWY